MKDLGLKILLLYSRLKENRKALPMKVRFLQCQIKLDIGIIIKEEETIKHNKTLTNNLMCKK